MNLKQLVVMSAVAVATGCTSSQQHTSTPFDEYPVYEGNGWKWLIRLLQPASRFGLLRLRKCGCCCTKKGREVLPIVW